MQNQGPQYSQEALELFAKATAIQKEIIDKAPSIYSLIVIRNTPANPSKLMPVVGRRVSQTATQKRTNQKSLKPGECEDAKLFLDALSSRGMLGSPKKKPSTEMTPNSKHLVQAYTTKPFTSPSLLASEEDLSFDDEPKKPSNTR